jgi:hypothetical protein
MGKMRKTNEEKDGKGWKRDVRQIQAVCHVGSP